MQLTDIGEETNIRTGQTTFYLVLDGGGGNKLRVPVPKETVLEIFRSLAVVPVNTAVGPSHAEDEVVDNSYDPLADQM